MESGSDTKRPSCSSWPHVLAVCLLVFVAGSIALHVGRRISLVAAPALILAPRPVALLVFYAAGLLSQPLFWLGELPGKGSRGEGVLDLRTWRGWGFVASAFCFVAALGFLGFQSLSRWAQWRYATEAAPGWGALSATGEWFVYAASLGVGLAIETILHCRAKGFGRKGRPAVGRTVSVRRSALVIVAINAAGLVAATVVALLV